MWRRLTFGLFGLVRREPPKDQAKNIMQLKRIVSTKECHTSILTKSQLYATCPLSTSKAPTIWDAISANNLEEGVRLYLSRRLKAAGFVSVV